MRNQTQMTLILEGRWHNRKGDRTIGPPMASRCKPPATPISLSLFLSFPFSLPLFLFLSLSFSFSSFFFPSLVLPLSLITPLIKKLKVEKVAQSTNMLNPIRYKYWKYYTYYKYYKYHKFIGQKKVLIRFQLSPINLLKCGIMRDRCFFLGAAS